jgi:hypothetical protein
VSLELVARIPCAEGLEDVAVGGHQAEGEQQLGEQVEVAIGHQVMQAEGMAKRDRDQEHHGEAFEHRAEHEVGREDGAVPARLQARTAC